MSSESPRAPMLLELAVENLAIVDKLELSFGPGLNVLTGETGAGKSILVDALAILLGGRATSDWVRSGETQGSVSAVLDLGDSEPARRRFIERGFELEGTEVLLRRTIGKSGRGKVTINGQIATVALLAQVTRGLIDICGQHEHVTLVDPETHLDLLDAFGGLRGEAEDVAACFDALSAALSELRSLEGSEAEKLRREDFLRFSIEEIRNLAPVPGELESLAAERTRLANVTRISEGVRRLGDSLDGDENSVLEVFGRIESDLSELSRLDGRLSPLAKSAAGVAAELSELSRGLGRYARTLEAEPERLLEVEERLEALRRIVRKHGRSIEEVLGALSRMEAELASLTSQEERRAALSTEVDGKRRALIVAAQTLSQRRKAAAAGLGRSVEAELSSLAMGSTRVVVELAPLTEPNRRGFEKAEILIAPNPGEPPRPLVRTASGGELSRLLLSFKRVLADRDSVATYVFDEVDSGIGGRVAEILGKKLHDVASGRQVLCITHLPQVAAYADHHFRVEKRVDGGRTRTQVMPLDDGASVDELARMLGGLDITAKTRELAHEMRARATGTKDSPRASIR